VKYIPLDYADNTPPSFRGSPNDWLVPIGKGFAIAIDDTNPDSVTSLLTKNQIVVFKAIDYFGRFGVKKTGEMSWEFVGNDAEKVVPRATHFCIDGKPETYSRTIDAIISTLAIGESVLIVHHRYSGSESFMFDGKQFKSLEA
jgi:hypothetical protein